MLHHGLVVTMTTWIDLVAAGSSNLASPSVMLAPNKNPSRRILKNPKTLRKFLGKKNQANESIKLEGEMRSNVPVTHLPEIKAFIR